MKIVVAILTRQRPKMLQTCLESCARLRVRPEDSVVLLVVENDTERTATAIIEQVRSQFPVEVRYVNEPEIGIPIARNTAARIAIDEGADALAFIDDDEVADVDWLSSIVSEFRESGAFLVGGPVDAEPPGGQMTFFQNVLFNSIKHRYALKAKKNARHSKNNNGMSRVTIVTSNWLGDVRLFTEHGLKFDETMRYTGGSDSKFYSEVKDRGIKASWADGAVVRETIPEERISYHYQYRRARSQSIVSCQRKIARNKTFLVLIPLSVSVRAFGVVYLAFLTLLSPRKGLVGLARSTGWIAGRIRAALGARSDLYAQVTGS